MKSHRSLIRRFCFALVAVRTLAFAVAPFIDLRWVPAGGTQLAVQAANDPDGRSAIPQHEAGTCAICAVMHDAPWSPASSDASALVSLAARAPLALVSAATAAAPQQGFLSRAPPAFG